MKFESYHQEKRYYERQASEEEFLAWYHQQDLPTYEKPSVTVDNLIFGYEDNQLKILLIKRKSHPFINHFAFPGGFLKKTESPDESAIREAEEETGLKLEPHHLQQFKTIGTPGRDPRAWVMTIAYLVFLPTMKDLQVRAGGDANDVQWLTLEEALQAELAFDHKEILLDVVGHLKKNNSVKVLGDHAVEIVKSIPA